MVESESSPSADLGENKQTGPNVLRRSETSTKHDQDVESNYYSMRHPLKYGQPVHGPEMAPGKEKSLQPATLDQFQDEMTLSRNRSGRIPVKTDLSVRESCSQDFSMQELVSQIMYTMSKNTAAKGPANERHAGYQNSHGRQSFENQANQSSSQMLDSFKSPWLSQQKSSQQPKSSFCLSMSLSHSSQAVPSQKHTTGGPAPTEEAPILQNSVRRSELSRPSESAFCHSPETRATGPKRKESSPTSSSQIDPLIKVSRLSGEHEEKRGDSQLSDNVDDEEALADESQVRIKIVAESSVHLAELEEFEKRNLTSPQSQQNLSPYDSQSSKIAKIRLLIEENDTQKYMTQRRTLKRQDTHFKPYNSPMLLASAASVSASSPASGGQITTGQTGLEGVSRRRLNQQLESLDSGSQPLVGTQASSSTIDVLNLKRPTLYQQQSGFHSAEKVTQLNRRATQNPAAQRAEGQTSQDERIIFNNYIGTSQQLKFDNMSSDSFLLSKSSMRDRQALRPESILASNDPGAEPSADSQATTTRNKQLIQFGKDCALPQILSFVSSGMPHPLPTTSSFVGGKGATSNNGLTRNDRLHDNYCGSLASGHGSLLQQFITEGPDEDRSSTDKSRITNMKSSAKKPDAAGGHQVPPGRQLPPSTSSETLSPVDGLPIVQLVAAKADSCSGALPKLQSGAALTRNAKDTIYVDNSNVQIAAQLEAIADGAPEEEKVTASLDEFQRVVLHGQPSEDEQLGANKFQIERTDSLEFTRNSETADHDVPAGMSDLSSKSFHARVAKKKPRDEYEGHHSDETQRERDLYSMAKQEDPYQAAQTPSVSLDPQKLVAGEDEQHLVGEGLILSGKDALRLSSRVGEMEYCAEDMLLLPFASHHSLRSEEPDEIPSERVLLQVSPSQQQQQSVPREVEQQDDRHEGEEDSFDQESGSCVPQEVIVQELAGKESVGRAPLAPEIHMSLLQKPRDTDQSVSLQSSGRLPAEAFMLPHASSQIFDEGDMPVPAKFKKLRGRNQSKVYIPVVNDRSTQQAPPLLQRTKDVLLVSSSAAGSAGPFAALDQSDTLDQQFKRSRVKDHVQRFIRASQDLGTSLGLVKDPPSQGDLTKSKRSLLPHPFTLSPQKGASQHNRTQLSSLQQFDHLSAINKANQFGSNVGGGLADSGIMSSTNMNFVNNLNAQQTLLPMGVNRSSQFWQESNHYLRINENSNCEYQLKNFTCAQPLKDSNDNDQATNQESRYNAIGNILSYNDLLQSNNSHFYDDFAEQNIQMQQPLSIAHPNFPNEIHTANPGVQPRQLPHRQQLHYLDVSEQRYPINNESQRPQIKLHQMLEPSSSSSDNFGQLLLHQALPHTAQQRYHLPSSRDGSSYWKKSAESLPETQPFRYLPPQAQPMQTSVDRSSQFNPAPSSHMVEEDLGQPLPMPSHRRQAPAIQILQDLDQSASLEAPEYDCADEVMDGPASICVDDVILQENRRFVQKMSISKPVLIQPDAKHVQSTLVSPTKSSISTSKDRRVSALSLLTQKNSPKQRKKGQLSPSVFALNSQKAKRSVRSKGSPSPAALTRLKANETAVYPLQQSSLLENTYKSATQTPSSKKKKKKGVKPKYKLDLSKVLQMQSQKRQSIQEQAQERLDSEVPEEIHIAVQPPVIQNQMSTIMESLSIDQPQAQGGTRNHQRYQSALSQSNTFQIQQTFSKTKRTPDSRDLASGIRVPKISKSSAKKHELRQVLPAPIQQQQPSTARTHQAHPHFSRTVLSLNSSRPGLAHPNAIFMQRSQSNGSQSTSKPRLTLLSRPQNTATLQRHAEEAVQHDCLRPSATPGSIEFQTKETPRHFYRGEEREAPSAFPADHTADQFLLDADDLIDGSQQMSLDSDMQELFACDGTAEHQNQLQHEQASQQYQSRPETRVETGLQRVPTTHLMFRTETQFTEQNEILTSGQKAHILSRRNQLWQEPEAPCAVPSEYSGVPVADSTRRQSLSRTSSCQNCEMEKKKRSITQTAFQKAIKMTQYLMSEIERLQQTNQEAGFLISEQNMQQMLEAQFNPVDERGESEETAGEFSSTPLQQERSTARNQRRERPCGHHLRE